MNVVFCRTKKDEGYSRVVYKDEKGNDSIGYGFLVSSLELDRDICNIILMRKLFAVEDELTIKIDLQKFPEKIREVLIEMAYQLGIQGLMNFEITLEYANRREWSNMADEMLDSDWARYDSPNRAKRLSDIVRSVENGI